MGQASLHAVIYGRVQGVKFRAHTASQAEALRLRGWVRNLPDGTVEVLAAGERTSLQDLERWLQEGPPLAEVLRVDAAWEGETDLPPGFHITG